MRFSSLSTLLLPALAYGFVAYPQAARTPPEALLPSATSTPASESQSIALEAPAPTANPLELREVVNGVAATLSADAASVTTQWVETEVNGVATYMPIVYTYTFASVVSQAAQPGKGEIGMGTLTGTIGVTKTVQAAAAETVGFGAWKRGLVAAAAVGVGLVV